MSSQKLKRVVLKEEMVAVTGNPVSALVLNQMVYWTGILNDSDREILKDIENNKKLGLDHKAAKLEKQLRHGWFWKSAKELSEELMNIASRGTIDRKLKELVADKFLEVRKNPKNKMDKTNHYRVDLNFLRQELKKLGYALEGYAIPEDEEKQESEESPSQRIAQNEQSEETLIQRIAQNEQSNAQNEQSITHCEQTIPEITSEISNQQITSKESIIQEEIKNLELPSLTKRVLLNKIDRLILFNIELLEVEVLFHNTELEDKPFADVLNDVLNSEIKKSFKRKMQVSIQNYIKSLNSKEVIEPKHGKPVREELMPESWKQNKANQEPKKKVVMSEEEKQAIREQVKQLSNG